MSGFPININPSNLSYAIETSGFSKELLIEKLEGKKFTLDKLNNILSGSIKPLHSELKKIDKILKRGLLFYFLNEIPIEENIISFREKDRNAILAPESIPKLREYYYKRMEINDLLKNINITNKISLPKYNVKTSPSSAAESLRGILNYKPSEF